MPTLSALGMRGREGHGGHGGHGWREARWLTDCESARRNRPATPAAPPTIAPRLSPPRLSLRLGHIAALTVHRTVIHYRDAASLPEGEA